MIPCLCSTNQYIQIMDAGLLAAYPGTLLPRREQMAPQDWDPYRPLKQEVRLVFPAPRKVRADGSIWGPVRRRG